MAFDKAAISRIVEEARTAARQLELCDPQEPGLRIRAGKRSANWVLNCRLSNGKRTRIKLGAWPALGISDARIAAQKQRHAIIDGADPNAKKRKAAEKAKTELASQIALGKALDLYEQDHLVHLRRGAQTRRALDGKSGLLSRFIRMPISEITETQIRVAVRDHAKRAPLAANRNLAYARAFFNWCCREQLLKENPARSVKKPAAERCRERWHTIEELSVIWSAAQMLGYPFSPLIRLLVTIPMRREEIAAMRIDELTFDRNLATVWTLPAARTKTKRALRVPLPGLASQIVQEALDDSARPIGTPYLFSTTGDTPVSGFSKAKRRLDTLIEASGTRMEHWTIHDLRTTFATLASDELAIPMNVADRMLNHVASSTTSKIERTYNRSELFDARKGASEKWAELLRDRVAISKDKRVAEDGCQEQDDAQSSFSF